MSDDQDKNQDTVDALHALVSEDVEAEPQEASAEGEFDPMSVIGDSAPSAAAPDMADIPPIEVSSSTLGQRNAKFHARAQAAQTHQLKSIAIPLLITVGLLLFVCSGTAIWQVLTATEESTLAAEDSLLPMRYRAPFALAGIPIGAFLLFGAYHFRKELQLIEQASQRGRGGEAG